ncbi:MAG TPA: MBL fold metallo-hydrolase [Vicinamibacterales bacterium]|nr:MBL fold metallo-hydrolase [Vicinamibacterales bacterium]
MPSQRVLASGVTWFDLLFQGRPNRIACGVVTGAAGTAIVDPGPTSTIETLEASLAMQGQSLASVTHIVLTHIHLDHAGATGTILRRHPGIRVVVHERGARHLVDPSKLVESASRLYGDLMETLWGEVAPVPERNLIVLKGGETIEAGGRSFEVEYTPGHASHHVCFFDRSSGIAFVGDTAGVCVDGGYVLPPTPPPDIDVELWLESIQAIDRWRPSTLFLTHFGPVTAGVSAHLQTLADNLQRSAALVRESLETGGTDEERKAHYESRMMAELRAQMPEELARAYETAAGFRMSWPGLARYWRKKESAPAKS